MVAAVALAAGVPVTSNGVAGADAPTYERLHVQFTAVDGDGNGCDAEVGTVGDLACRGTFGGTGATAPFDGDARGSARWERPSAGADMRLELGLPGAQVQGTVANAQPGELHLTSGVATWASAMSTPDEVGVPAGEQGGPLSLAITSDCPQPDACNATIVADGWVLASPAPVPPPLANGEDWKAVTMRFHTAPIYKYCSAPYGVPGTVTCSGQFDDVNAKGVPYTWPFADGSAGTVRTNGLVGVDPIRITLFVPGAELDGSAPSRRSDRFAVESAKVPWGRVIPIADDPAHPAGTIGGPFYIDASRHDGSDYVEADGWVKVASTSVGGPSSTTTTVTAANPTASTTAAVVAAQPRFTG